MRLFVILVLLCLPKISIAQNAQFSDDANFFLVGDSFTNGSTEWAARIRASSTPFELNFFSAGGRSLSQISEAFMDNYRPDTYDAVVIAGGVNDVAGVSSSLMVSENADLRDDIVNGFSATVKGIIERTNGEHVILTTIPPFRGGSFWTLERQQIADQYDTWVRGFVADQPNVSLFDIGTVLDSDGDQIIDPQHASNDNFHPQACGFGEECGASFIADSFITQFQVTSVPEPSTIVFLSAIFVAALGKRRRRVGPR